MKFAGKVWRLLVGIKDMLALLFLLLFFAAIWGALSISPHADSAWEGALKLELSGPIVEQPSEPSALAALQGQVITEHRLRDVVHALDRAAENDRIKAVALDLDLFVGGGQTTLANVADALDRVRRSNKPVIAFATGYFDDSYLLAAHASEVWLDPMGAVAVAGPGGTNLYFAELLDRLGVTANVYRVGTFKSAVEPYTRSDMSPEARQANQALAGSLWETWLQDVRQARPKAQVAAFAANPIAAVQAANGNLAQAALRAGMVDRVGTRQAFERRVAEVAGESNGKGEDAYNAVLLNAFVAEDEASTAGGEIGVLTVAGEIVDGEAGLGTAAAERIVGNLEKALEAGNLKALVVRVDSPGGSALASERIRQALLEARRRGLPVVISFGSVAASGGYWVATGGDTIFAEPSTITGSIGVFGILPSFQGTLEQIGVGADGVQTTPLSGEPNLFEGPSPAASALLQAGVEDVYRRFLNIVAEARNMPVQRVNEIGQGRVWAGGTARQLGLVDRFGSLDDAVAEAARRANLDPEAVEVTWLEEEPGVWARLISGMSSADAPAARDVFTRMGQRPEAALRAAVRDLAAIGSGPAIQARCLDCGFSPVAGPVARSETSLLARLFGWAIAPSGLPIGR